MKIITKCAGIVVLSLFTVTGAVAGGGMSLLGASSTDSARPAARACPSAEMSGDLRLGVLSGASVADIEERARLLGVSFDAEKLGGLLIKRYHFQAEGCSDAVLKLRAYLERLSGR